MGFDVKFSFLRKRNITKFSLLSVLLLLLFFGCSKPTDEEVYESPSVISGRVTNLENAPLADVKITIITSTQTEPGWSDANGLFRFDNFPSGKHTLRFEKVGYQTKDIEVPKPVNGVASMFPALNRRSYSVPSVKPLSKGKIRINRKVLETDFDGDGIYSPFIVKGVAFSPVPIGGNGVPDKIIDRSFEYLRSLNANTIRTYSGASSYLLNKAQQYGIYVVVSYWVNYGVDLSNSTERQKILEGFQRMVLELKDYPAVLMWNLGNEQNYQNGNNSDWYTLVQEMAIEAYKIEGENYRPVCASNGGFYNIGSASKNADDASLTYMDLWASNAYQYDFTSYFADYRSKSTKPVYMSEWGIDALDNRTKTLYEATQASFDSLNWMQIRNASDICIGGTVFEFTDEWWKDTNPFTHDYGGYNTGSHPDGYSNEEWWGIIAVTPDTDNDGLDEWRARPAYYMFQRNWKE